MCIRDSNQLADQIKASDYYKQAKYTGNLAQSRRPIVSVQYLISSADENSNTNNWMRESLIELIRPADQPVRQSAISMDKKKDTSPPKSLSNQLKILPCPVHPDNRKLAVRQGPQTRN